MRSKRIFGRSALLDPMGSWAWWRSWMLIFLGCTIMSVGLVLFIFPYNFVPGGINGAAVVLHNLVPQIKIGTFGYILEFPLMLVAFLALGAKFGARTIVAAFYTFGIINLLTEWVYPNAEAVRTLDPAQLLGGSLNLSNDLMLACLVGAVILGVGQGIVVRQQASTGGTDIIGMLFQKFTGIKFSTGILMADGVVILSGLVVIGFGIGLEGPAAGGWTLTLYSLITSYTASRVVARMLDGASYDKLLFIVSEHPEQLRGFITDELDRGATYIKARGVYTGNEHDMIFLVVSRSQVHLVQHRIRDIDPGAFVVVTDAYDTYGQGFKAFPSGNEMTVE